jgi:hypothetical protein
MGIGLKPLRSCAASRIDGPFSPIYCGSDDTDTVIVGAGTHPNVVLAVGSSLTVPALLTMGPRAFWRAFRLPDHIHLTGGFRLENA